MYRKLVALLLVIPFFAQNVYSETEETDTTGDESKTNTKSDDINNINKKIERKDFLSKEIKEISNRFSGCKDANELQELSKTLADYQNEFMDIEDEETRAGISFRQRRYEANAIKNKDIGAIEKLIDTLKEKRKEFLERQKLAQDRLQRANKNTRPEDKANFRENLNNLNLGITNLETKIKELTQTVARLKSEELMTLKKRQETLQKQLEKMYNSFPKKDDDQSDREHIKDMQKWSNDVQKIGKELRCVNQELEKMTAQNDDVPSE